MTKDEILADMRGLFGRKTMLSPADIAEVISQSEGAQAVARHRGRFDIPLRKRGRSVYVSLHELVDWLHAQEEGPGPNPSAPESPSNARRPPPSGPDRRQASQSQLGILLGIRAAGHRI